MTNKTLFREWKQILYRKRNCMFELWSSNIMRPRMTKHIITRLWLNDIDAHIKHCKGWYYKLMSNGWWGGGSGWIRILPRPLLFHVSCVPSRTQHKQDQTIHVLWMLSNPLTKQLRTSKFSHLTVYFHYIINGINLMQCVLTLAITKDFLLNQNGYNTNATYSTEWPK